MKKKLLMSIFLASLVVGDPIPEIPKSRGANNTPSTHLNAVSGKPNNVNNSKGGSIQPDSSSQIQPDNRQNIVVQTTQSPQQQQIFVSNGQQLQQQPQQYFLTVNPNATPMTGVSGQTPIIMQYLPQGQAQPGQYQYIQLVATRPLVYPQFVQPQQLPHQFLPSVPQTHSNSLSGPAQTQFNPIIGHSGQTSPHTFPTYSPLNAPPQTIVGGYSNHQPVVSPYYGPAQRVHLVGSPHDLSLNTNEYFPKGANDFRAKSRIK